MPTPLLTAAAAAGSAASSAASAISSVASSAPIYVQMVGGGSGPKDLIPLATGLLGAAVALLANTLSNRHSLKLTMLNAKTNARQRSNELSVERLEELHVLFDKWQQHIQQIYLLHLRVYADKLTLAQAKEMIREGARLPAGEIQRISMLLAIYAPGLQASYDAVDAARAANAPFLAGPEESLLSKSQFIEAQNSFSRTSKDFLQAIALETRRIRALV